MSQDPNEIYVIPKDAIVPIDIGAGFIARLQKILFFLVEDKSQQEIDQFKSITDPEGLPEDSWMYHFNTIQQLLLALEQKAIAADIAVKKSVDDQQPPVS